MSTFFNWEEGIAILGRKCDLFRFAILNRTIGGWLLVQPII